MRVLSFPSPAEVVEKALQGVTPAKAGVQKGLKILDSGLRQNDETDCTAHLSTPSAGEGQSEGLLLFPPS